MEQYFLLDYFFMGHFKTLYNVIDNLPTDMIGNIHTEFAKSVMKLDYYVVQLPEFDLKLIRPNVRDFKTEDITNETIQLKFMEWGQNKGFIRDDI
jgi:hypothetical protein